ncbi:flagellar hook-associated protein FlgK [Halanaerobiaceae bacterium Z-7014]|uniref:Flagellar hook-associated protein 1 n=1 Tax=Halonatronomonas betaini TaxID=2778430 RepID=A0A931ARV2_9FIRM|nr:flagellar hook-associated protein FlgK [Halonatronomonas betaini]MBF8437853.1 flagellar hook-associated protein FlgK [Halonatronomonas betaini]
MNSFSSINTALSALQAQQRALDTTGHNIANSNTEGYSRQRAELSAARPYTSPGMNMPTTAGQVGQGVQVDNINRLRDDFIDGQIRRENQAGGYWDQVSEGLSRLELIYNEPSDNNLGNSLNEFWGSLQELSNDPQDSAIRSTVRQRAVTLTDTFHSLHDQMSEFKSSINNDVHSTVDEINSIIERIGDINKEIVHIKGSGQQPNDLMDTRDKLFDQLNEKVDARGSTDSRGNLDISIGGVKVVSGSSTNQLEIREDPDNNYEDTIHYSNIGKEIQVERGELKGLLEVRDEIIPAQLDELDTIAREMAEHFNRIHSTGYDLDGEQGGDFFELPDEDSGESPAQLIEVSQEIMDSTRKIAAGNFSDNPRVAEVNNPGTGDSPYRYRIRTERPDEDGNVNFTIAEMEGDEILNEFSGTAEIGESFELTEIEDAVGEEFSGVVDDVTITLKSRGEANITLDPSEGSGENATALARGLNEDQLEGLDNTSVNKYFEGVISSLGVDGQRAEQMVENSDLLKEQLNNRREAISGVSLDEELSNMIKFQQAYGAAANIITTQQQNMDTLLGLIR